ncbi:hypothetical protein TD95_003968 [Thielaviopsis punctulata]|uniref:Major facilitator superfamily (MFS) profile domain-containing protein n=1 Tax=Thielaviopsis punctulata TaxID=72032 RepID=A0A0F4Z8A8_9PEZI|nr:hypothetical protein TD95_003968 [Thielaviopsis punctulata]
MSSPPLTETRLLDSAKPSAHASPSSAAPLPHSIVGSDAEITHIAEEEEDSEKHEYQNGLSAPLHPVRTGTSLRRVPTKQRRGYGLLTLVPEVENPRAYGYASKWLLTVIVALAAVAGPMGSSILYPALQDMSIDLNTSLTTANITVSTFMLGMAIFPIWWSSLSEVLGRRLMYLCSFSLFVLFGALSASSTSIGMMIALRFLSGGASASVQTVGTGTISDIWPPEERGRAMGVFYMGPLLGPMVAPLLGGAIAEAKGWRWTLWLLTMYGGVVLLLIFFVLPETSRKKLAPATSHESTSRDRVKAATKRYLVDPVKVLFLIQHRVIFCVVFFAALTFGAVYVLNISLTMVFEAAPYKFNQVEVGLMYMPMSTGYMFTSFLAGGWSDHIMKTAQRRAKRVDANGVPIYYPEDRFGINLWIAAVLYPLSMMAYGWVLDYHRPWWASVIPLFFFGVGTMIVFGVATASLTEFVPRRSSAGVAVNNFIRNIFSFAGSMISKPAIDAGGTGKVFTILGAICLVVCIGSLAVLKVHGARWRESLDLAEEYSRRKPVAAVEELENDSSGREIDGGKEKE